MTKTVEFRQSVEIAALVNGAPVMMRDIADEAIRRGLEVTAGFDHLTMEAVVRVTGEVDALQRFPATANMLPPSQGAVE